MYNVTFTPTGLVNFIQLTNTNILDSMGGIVLLIMVGVIFFTAYYSKTEELFQSLGLASLIVSFSSLVLLGLNLVTDDIVWFCWIITALSGLMLYLSDRYG